MHGTLHSWRDDRGFGFINPSDGGPAVFVHIKAFPAGSGRPQVGQRLGFELASGPGGKPRAVAVRLLVPPGQGRAAGGLAPGARWSTARALAVPALLVLYALVVLRWGFRPQVPLLYGVMSVAAFFAYAFDKSAAANGRWRTAENTLHLLALAGGWPGALLAQQVLRHKTRKPAFVAAFWVTVLANGAGLVLWHAGGIGGLMR